MQTIFIFTLIGAIALAKAADTDIASILQGLLGGSNSGGGNGAQALLSKLDLNKIDLKSALKPKSNLDCREKTDIDCVTNGLSGVARSGKSCLAKDKDTGDDYAEKLYLELQKCEQDILLQYVDSATGCVGTRRTKSRKEDIWAPESTKSLSRSASASEKDGLINTAVDGCSSLKAPCIQNRGSKDAISKAADANRRAVVMAKKRCKKLRFFFENPQCSECRMVALQKMINDGCDIEKCARDPQYWDDIYNEETVEINMNECIKEKVNLAECDRKRRA